jgi:phosphoglucomutase
MASHNPSRYNGYKVYGDDGCQITTQAAADILKEIEALDVFEDVRRAEFDAAFADGRISWIPEQIYTDFTEEVKKQSLLGPDDEVDRNVAIVYSPLNGTGLKPVMRVLKESGYQNITVVKEQEKPDGHFPTCPYPNPEIREAMELGMRYAAERQADLLMATDPDCDRVGIAVREKDGSFRLLSGNETGILLLDYICSRRQALGKMPADPVFVKTIVTMDMAERLAAHYGVRTVNVLTGFKFIGEQIGLLEKQGKEDSYIFGFEESYGYLSGSYVRDKDAVDGAFLIAEMFSYYKTRGISLTEKLQELYDLYGYTYNTLHSFEFEGSAGFDRMQAIMKDFHGKAESGETQAFGGLKVLEIQDYSKGLNNLPKSDVLKYMLEGHSSAVVRPSGTEPKLKLYLSVTAPDREAAQAMEEKLAAELGQAFS